MNHGVPQHIHRDDVEMPMHPALVKLSVHGTRENIQFFVLRISHIGYKFHVERNVVRHLEVV